VSRQPNDIRILTAILMAVFALTACSGVLQSEKPAINVWWLQPVSTAPRADNAVSPVTLALDITTVPGIDSGRILALSSDAQLKPYAGARWADEVPDLADSLITRSLKASGRFDVVQHGRAGAVAPDCTLRLELNEFFGNLDSAGHTRGVSVAIDGSFRCGQGGAHAVASRADVDVAADNMSVIVAAFQQALDQVTLDIIKQIHINQ